jgi:hypothetical protein
MAKPTTTVTWVVTAQDSDLTNYDRFDGVGDTPEEAAENLDDKIHRSLAAHDGQILALRRLAVALDRSNR